MTLTLAGAAHVKRQLTDQLRKTQEGFAAAVYQKGLAIMADSVKLVPVDTGRLRASHYVAPPRGREPEVEIGYGTDYAVPVHERTEIHHEVGQAKFLEAAVNKHRRGYAEAVARLARRNIKKGIGFRSVPQTAPRAPRE